VQDTYHTPGKRLVSLLISVVSRVANTFVQMNGFGYVVARPFVSPKHSPYVNPGIELKFSAGKKGNQLQHYPVRFEYPDSTINDHIPSLVKQNKSYICLTGFVCSDIGNGKNQKTFHVEFSSLQERLFMESLYKIQVLSFA
jgi:hypothetical protein